MSQSPAPQGDVYIYNNTVYKSGQNSNLGTSDKFYGSTLTYGLQDNEFDAYLHIHAYDFQTEDFADTEIEWNRTDYSGHIKSENFFKDTEWHCWDMDGNDISCN